MKKLQTIGSVLAAGAVMATPFLAFADTSVSTDANVNANVGIPGVTVSTDARLKAEANQQARREERASSTMQKLDERGGAEIDARISSLTNLEGRINNLARLTADQKSALVAALTAEINQLTALKAQITADTSSTTLRTDVESITKSYRVYALVMPQANVSAASDRILSVAAQFAAFAAKLQARISAAASAGVNVTAANTAYADMQAKVADAKTQAQAAASEVAGLKPDNGDKTLFASNQQTLKDARAKLKAAEADLKAARQDVNAILKVVRGTGVGATASTTASTSVSH